MRDLSSSTCSSKPSRYGRIRRLLTEYLLRPAIAAILAVTALDLSLLATSMPLMPYQYEKVERAITLLESKGFENDAFLLRNVASFRTGDNWINQLNPQENAYAATNFPFAIITLYPDFYANTSDDVERAMILLHEAQHLKNADEHDAYSYVWQHKGELGWTTLTHGTTPMYVSVELQTREAAPDLFTCAEKVWHDCTETILVKRQK